MPNFLDEYLIRLGAVVDTSGMARFQTALREASTLVDHQATRMAGSFLKAQTEIVGGFAAIGGAALGLADKVAMADQEYRLFGLHMYMTKENARSLKIAMDALGQPLENLTWDPELRGRAQQLIADQRAMAPGGDFNAQMRKIRDIRFEFTRMEVELEYLGMHVVQDFMNALGFGPDELLMRLRKFNRWVITDLPQISARLVHDFMPIWKSLEEVFGALLVDLRETSILFSNLVGIFSADTSIMGTTFSLEHLSGALKHVAGGFATVAGLIAHTEQMLSHLITASMLASGGDFRGAVHELKAGYDSLSTKEAMMLMTGAFGGVFGGPLGAVMGAGAAYEGGTVLERTVGTGTVSRWRESLMSGSLIPGTGITGSSTLRSLMSALAWAESRYHQFGPDGKALLGAMTRTGRAMGMYQLMPSVAAQYGIDPSSLEGNTEGARRLLTDLLRHYNGDVPRAIGGYAAGQGRMDAFLAGKATLPDEARNEIAKVLGRMGQTGGVQVGSVYINITPPPGTSAAAIADEVKRKLADTQNKRVQRNLLEFQSLSASY